MRKRISYPILVILLLGLNADLSAQADYLVGDGDVLRIMVYDSPDLNTVARVNSGGTITFPLVGQVQIGGLTIAQAAEKIARKLADGYLRSPQISIFVEEFRSKKAVIMGQVRNPGLHELPGPISLLELISRAGGLAEGAGDTATIRRKAREGEEQLLQIRLKDLLEGGDAALDIQILDGDSIFIPKAGMVYVNGQVNRPGAYKLEEGTTVLKAITMAGGVTNMASQRRISIIRKIDGAEVVMKRVSLHERVLPEDVIVVPESFF
jgi:polysaccharide biosynthesis/export protein